MLSEEFSAETNPHTTKVKTVYHQEDAQAPIYNGDISGGVNNTTYERGSSFSDSHNQSTVERVITAGNNVNMPTTIQFYLDPSALAASTQSISNIITSLQQNLESAHAFYRSPQNRDHLVHSMANGEPSSSEATAVASAVLHYTIDSFVAPQGDTGTEGTDKDWEMEDTTQPSGSPDNQPGPTDVNITPFDDLDLTSIRSRARTNAEVYTRLMLSCVEGLPCWRPKPSPGTKGIIPGDVGTFDLAHGFRKLFNIWEREQGSQGRPFEAPPSAAVHLSSNHFPRGHAIANGASSSIRRSPDGQSVEQFEFDCISEQGAVLACTSSADLVELENLVSLKQYLNQNAGAIYQQAYLTEQFDSDSLYVVTGCIKTAGWGLAAYQGITSNQTMRLAQRPGGNSSPEDGKLYDWTGADCALSHDDDWRSTFKSSGSPSNPWNDALPLTIIASQTITVSNGVAHFEREIGNLDGFRNASAPSLGTETAEPVNEREEGRDSQLRDRQASPILELGIRQHQVLHQRASPGGLKPRTRRCFHETRLQSEEPRFLPTNWKCWSIRNSDVGYELIYAVTELFDLVPISELAPAAKTLLAIWDAVQNIEVNFYRCLRLTERCADLLISIRDEVHEAGDTVGQESAAPIGKLEDTFQGVLQFMQKQVQRPFLKRYLNRNEIQRDLDVCDEGLRDALSLFSLSIQIRILKQVQEPEKHRREETQALINAMVTGGTIQTSDVPRSPLQPIMGEQTGTDTTRSLSPISLDHKESMDSVQLFITTSNDLGLSDENTTSTASANGIIPLLAGLQQNQNSLDTTKDFTEIRLLMRRAIQAKTDVEMLEILQVKDEQAPEAIKTLQRALEKVASKSGSQEDALPPGLVIGKVTRSVSQKKADGKKSLQRSRTVISIESSTSSIASTAGSTASASATGSGSGRRNSGSRKRDTLNQEFIEAGISALMRMSQGRDTNLPSWTITKFEVDRTQQIGTGRFSKVYRGTWRSRTVAIKVVETEIAAKHFIRAVRIWKQLHHPNVLELYGASSGIGRPWFFVTPYMKRGNLVEYLRKVEIDLHQREDDRRSAEDERFEVRKQWDLFRFMLEIAQGMEYLHSRKVLHGDLKASKVLVDDRYHCVITDFGQREIESEAYELSGESPLRQGTMRWQAPEILTGEVEMTKETDVYAFSIVCAEIVNMGKLPLGTMFEDVSNRQSWADTIELSMPEPVMFTSNRSVHSVLGHEDGIAEGFDLLDLASDTTSLAPTDERVLERKNELRYRLLLDHPFHPSLVLPLWQPSLVQMGAVGYLKKPEGEFITLFNALSPVRSNNSAVASLPSIYAYGKADLRNQKQDKVNIIQKGLDTFVGFIGRSKNPATIPIRRRYSYELRAGQKAAHLCTESTEYVYMVTLNAARKWFQNNIDSIVRTFGQEHRIQREDIVLGERPSFNML
ncbi:hypothetical protein MD484_g6448, partial [Candolleomyces efflorescens]